MVAAYLRGRHVLVGEIAFHQPILGQKVRRTDNQAVDDKFTVLCYGTDETERTPPGLALDADPRSPFYRISRKIEQFEAGEGARIERYLALKPVQAQC